MKGIRGSTELEKQFIKVFNQLCNRHHSWQVWQDFVSMSAYAIANAVDRRSEVWKKREDSYMEIVKRYSKEELNLIPELLAITTLVLDEKPDQDFLGKLYMQLDFGSGWHGQFFTPWHVADLMAKMQLGDEAKNEIASKGYISVNDSCCGAGCLLMAFANACKDFGVNYQQSVFFVGQDVDEIVAKMCYIQISLLGCPGYVVVGNSLSEPVYGSTLEPRYGKPENIWFTPLYFTDTWLFHKIQSRTIAVDAKEEAKETVLEIVKPKQPSVRKQVNKKKQFSWKDFFTVKKKG